MLFDSSSDLTIFTQTVVFVRCVVPGVRNTSQSEETSYSVVDSSETRKRLSGCTGIFLSAQRKLL
jgi:hypothetical protein